MNTYQLPPNKELIADARVRITQMRADQAFRTVSGIVLGLMYKATNTDIVVSLLILFMMLYMFGTAASSVVFTRRMTKLVEQLERK